MGGLSAWHWIIVAIVALILFGGGGKIPKLMRDMGKGITAFKKGLKEDKDETEDEAGERRKIDSEASADAGPAEKDKEKEKTGTEG